MTQDERNALIDEILDLIDEAEKSNIKSDVGYARAYADGWKHARLYVERAKDEKYAPWLKSRRRT